jgi:hypothetical protein
LSTSSKPAQALRLRCICRVLTTPNSPAYPLRPSTSPTALMSQHTHSSTKTHCHGWQI